MLRRLSALVLLAVTGVLALAGIASATPYEAPPVTPAADPWVPVADPSAVAYTNTSDLASTGAGFSVGTAVAIGVAVLLVGVALMAISRMRKAHNH